jgi:CBS domain-containing protein
MVRLANDSLKLSKSNFQFIETRRNSRHSDTGSIPVCEGDKVIGMITDRDIAVRGIAEGRGPETLVRDLMTDHIICAHSDDNVDEIAQRMSQEQVRRLPVLDAEERLVGIISLGDLARETRGESAHEALEGVSQPGSSAAQ